jgi:chemosensory pili system protein ChpA (sensor histidine kinase/response regulator)
MMAAMLRRMGHRPIARCNGFDGWKLAEAILPELIVTDLEMPIWDGFDLIRAVRHSRLSRLRRQPIIVCSTRDDYHHLNLAIDLGADAYVTKPLRIAEMRLAIRNAVESAA